MQTRPWSTVEDAFILANRMTMPLLELAGQLDNRTYQSVQHRLRRLGQHAFRPRVPAWTDADNDYLRSRFGKEAQFKIAATLHRSESAVRQQLLALGLYQVKTNGVRAPRPLTDADGRVVDNSYACREYLRALVCEHRDHAVALLKQPRHFDFDNVYRPISRPSGQASYCGSAASMCAEVA